MAETVAEVFFFDRKFVLWLLLSFFFNRKLVNILI